MELPNDLKALLATMKLEEKEPEWKFTASSNQVTVQLTWIKAKDPDTTSRNPKPDLQKKHKPPSTRRRNTGRFTQWMDSKKAVASAATPVTTTSTSVDNICQTQARDTVIDIPLTPTKYRGEPEGINIKTDITSACGPYNSQKACHRRYFYTPSKPRSKRSRINFTEGFDIDGPDLLRTPSYTSPISMPDPEAIQTAFALQERPDTPCQPQPPGRSKIKRKRTADPTMRE
ncbi:unnamed protein product [Mytilus coruscus]|uniref:Uncharacterized protein n=1 Tax=Mytilus coruscus TaxID=42192 RepID=A0A6J8DLX3_MYTCO|nr:unnamed protein product [Mytilus coruscus]